MAIKELALITEKNNRKKKKEKEPVQLKAPTKQKTTQKPKTTTVKSNNKGKTYINKETISKKPTVQKTTQKRVVTNKERLSSKDTFAGVKNTVKPVKSTKKRDKVSTGVYDVYESGGKYYYDNGREEKEIDKKIVENALKNNRKGVIGHYDKKGKFTEVDENGRRLTPKVIRKEKRENLSKQLNAMKNDIKSGNMNVSRAITDVANIADAATDFGPGKVYKNALKTGVNAFDRVWTGSTRALEGVMDTANDLTTEITSRQNYLVNRAFGMSKKEAKKKMKEEQKANAEWVKRDLIKDFKDKTGYTKLQPQLEEGSLVTEKNLAGRILEGAGGMLPALAVGQAANLGLAAKSTEGLTGLAKAGTVLGNLGRGFANQAGANTILASTSYGSGIEEAYRNGATGKQARLYGLGNAVTELATEWLTGGIPGTKSEGVLDDIVESLIDKKTAKISNRYVSNVINAVVKSQAKGMGEGLEEAIAEIINPHLKNLTYSNGEKVNWEQVKDSALVGYAVGMFLNSPETIQEVKKGINDAKISSERKTALLNELNALVESNDIGETAQEQRAQANEIAQRVQSGEIDAITGNALLEQVRNGTYEQNKVVDQIAAQQRDAIEQAVQTGQMSQAEAVQEIQALNNTLDSERERINKPQQETQENVVDNKEKSGKKILYHASDYLFDKFDANERKKYKRYENEQDRAYFDESKQKVEQFGKYLYEVEVDLDKLQKSKDFWDLNEYYTAADEDINIINRYEINKDIDLEKISNNLKEADKGLKNLEKFKEKNKNNPNINWEKLNEDYEKIKNDYIEAKEVYDYAIENKYKKIDNNTEESEGTQQVQNVSQNGNIRVIDNHPVSTNKEVYNSQPKEGTIRLYTNTDAKNIDSILQNGLDVNKAKQNEYEGNMTWFETTPDLKGYGGTTIAVDVPINSNMDKVNDTQYTVYDNISPKNIVFVDKPVMNNYRTSDIEDLINKYGEDKVRNVFNKALENGKASMTQQEFNNLITSIKVENNSITSKTEQSVINEGEKTSGTFSTVAPYYSTQVNDNNYNDVRSNVEMEFTNKALNIASNLGIGVENIQNNVGGYSFDDGNGRVDELSYTYKLKDGTSNEDAKMFGCLLGDLGHETQESVVVGNYTNSNNENANLEYTLKLKDGSGIIKALKEAGITDYTFNKQTNELQLLLFKDDNGNFNENEILDQFQKLNKVLGGNISEPTKNYVESELIESKDRQDIYGQWLESNRGTENRELYNQVEEAYNKVKEFNDKKPKEEQSSFSNENEENVITIKNDNLKDIPKDQIKGEDTGVSIGGKQVQMEIPVDSKPNKLGQYVPKDGFTQKELKSGKLGDSQFYKNATERANFIIDEVRQKIKDDNYMQHYRKVTNEESMQEAFDDLNTRGTEAIADFFNNDKELTSKDTAMGYLLIEQSQANGDYDFSTQVLRKMRSSATNAAQTLQMYNYYARLTPEGMYRWCGDQLLRAQEIFEKNKTKKWIESNKDRWQLTKEETDFIKTQMERVQELNKMNDDDITTVDIKGKPKEVTVDRAKQVEIAKIQAMIENKIPPEKGKSINAWMRISMLGNLKTIGTRNPMGNIALRPINDIGDAFASIADYAISKKTGYRTKGILNPKAQVKGFKKGGSETVQDFRLGINTRNSKGNRFEIGEGKSFNDRHSTKSEVLNKGLNTLAKAGNMSDRGVSFLLDLGDRPFYEASYAQSLENQMKLNGIEKLEDVPDWMKKIAETEGLERTYQDDNKYTQSVIAIRRAMNNVNIKGYGLGDVIIPFAKTPANLTKAIVDYSPAGFVNAITKGKELRTAIDNGQFTPEMQHRFVNQLGKATAGTMLYAIGAALAKSGLITGAPDEDKDLADFMKNTLGIQPYSIKIGNKSYTYDWAQPVASGLAIPADISKTLKDAKKGEVDLEYIIHTAFSSGGKVLLEQSFLQGIQEVLGGYGDPIDNLLSEIEGLPARAIPTLMQQIVTYLDGTKRMSYGNKGTQNAIAQAQAKTPWAKDLPVYRNSLGKEVKMYGGKNNFFNVFINPANYSEGNVTKSAKEIYKVYQATNDKEILPRLVNNNLKNEDGSKLTNKQKSEFLKISGGIIDKNVKELTKDKDYQKMSDKKKAETIKGIVEYAYNKARKEITGHELSGANKKAENAQESGYAIADYFISNKMNKQEKKKSTQERNRYMEVKKKGIDGKTFDKFRAFVASDKARGESRTGGKTKRQKVIDYIQTLGNLTAKEKQALYEDWNNNQGFFTYYK